MLQARQEQAGDSPSTTGGAYLQQPRTDLQPTSTGSSTAAPQNTSALSQDQLQAAGLRVGDTRTLIQNSTSNKGGGYSVNSGYTVFWVVAVVVLFAAAWWLWRRSRGVLDASAAASGLPSSATSSSMRSSKKSDAEPTANLSESVASEPVPEGVTTKSRKAKSQHKKRKHKR